MIDDLLTSRGKNLPQQPAPPSLTYFFLTKLYQQNHLYFLFIENEKSLLLSCARVREEEKNNLLYTITQFILKAVVKTCSKSAMETCEQLFIHILVYPVNNFEHVFASWINV